MNIQSKMYPLEQINIDTDQIIPAEFLKQVDKSGLGKVVFYNWRFGANVLKDFPLDDAIRSGAEVIIAGRNFGCGSSREHAAWALSDFGIKAIVSSRFADIFKTNAFYSGILLIELEEKDVNLLMNFSQKYPKGEIKINLLQQTISAEQIAFEKVFHIDPFKKECLVQGINETEYLINNKSLISRFQEKHSY